jgi:hypothetical protein
MKNKKNILFILLIFSLTTFIFSSCGGSGGGSGGFVPSGSGATGTGSVAILLTDNFTEEFSKIIITITKIELLSDNGKHTIFSGSRQFDFLNLRNETTLLVIEDGVPAMWYEKIRLTVEDVKLYDASGDPIIEPVDLTGNKKIDLNPRKQFHIGSGEMITIQLDLDAKNSLIKQNNNKYKFDPVVFIDIIDSLPSAKLVRVGGMIHDIDEAAGMFTLCPVRIEGTNDMDYDDGSCIIVSVSEDTSLFDADTNGRPASFEDLMVRDSVTAIGFFSRMTCPSEDHNNFDGNDNHDRDSCKVLDAVVVEIGAFEKIKGTILSAVDTSTQPYTFALELDPGQLPVTGNEIDVLLQDDTKIFSVKNGELVRMDSLVPGRPVEIDGISLDTNSDSEPDIINAVFILIELAEKLSGEIADINYRNMTFNLGLVNDCVHIPEDAKIYLIDNIENSSEIIDIGGLSRGMQVDAYGYEYDSSGCLEATTIIAFE